MESARAANTPYAIAQGLNQSAKEKAEDGEVAVWWWTRSRCFNDNNAQDISDVGRREVGNIGHVVDSENGGVRPAMRVYL